MCVSGVQGAVAPGTLPGSAPRALVDVPPPPHGMASNHSSLGSTAELGSDKGVPLPASASGGSEAAGPSVGWAASSA